MPELFVLDLFSLLSTLVHAIRGATFMIVGKSHMIEKANLFCWSLGIYSMKQHLGFKCANIKWYLRKNYCVYFLPESSTDLLPVACIISCKPRFPVTMNLCALALVQKLWDLWQKFHVDMFKLLFHLRQGQLICVQVAWEKKIIQIVWVSFLLNRSKRQHEAWGTVKVKLTENHTGLWGQILQFTFTSIGSAFN